MFDHRCILTGIIGAYLGIGTMKRGWWGHGCVAGGRWRCERTPQPLIHCNIIAQEFDFIKEFIAC